MTTFRNSEFFVFFYLPIFILSHFCRISELKRSHLSEITSLKQAHSSELANIQVALNEEKDKREMMERSLEAQGEVVISMEDVQPFASVRSEVESGEPLTLGKSLQWNLSKKIRTTFIQRTTKNVPSGLS